MRYLLVTKRKKTQYVILIVFLMGIIGAELICMSSLSIRKYNVSLSGVIDSVRIVVVSDLHGREFGDENTRLLEKIQAQKPNVIFLDGDIIDRSADSASVQKLLRLLETLCEIAPVFFAPGNHELEYMESNPTLLEQIEAAGAAVVNDSYVDVTIAGQPLRIGGTMGHGFYFGRTEEEFISSPEYQFLKEFEDCDIPTICLAHMPDTFIFNGAYDLWDVDLVVSGHTHGGLVRLPVLGGLYAPMQGWFPKYDQGLFQLGEHMQMIITSGLAGHGWIPRVNNPPEIAVVELIPQTSA